MCRNFGSFDWKQDWILYRGKQNESLGCSPLSLFVCLYIYILEKLQEAGSCKTGFHSWSCLCVLLLLNLVNVMGSCIFISTVKWPVKVIPQVKLGICLRYCSTINSTFCSFLLCLRISYHIWHLWSNTGCSWSWNYGGFSNCWRSAKG